jgi:hypothetical protein
MPWHDRDACCATPQEKHLCRAMQLLPINVPVMKTTDFGKLFIAFLFEQTEVKPNAITLNHWPSALLSFEPTEIAAKYRGAIPFNHEIKQ